MRTGLRGRCARGTYIPHFDNIVYSFDKRYAFRLSLRLRCCIRGAAGVFSEITMKHIFPKLSAVALLAAASFAQAATLINTPGFTISYADGTKPTQWNIGLQQSTPGSATFDLATMNRQLTSIYVGPNNWQTETEANAFHYSVLHVDVHDGYKIANLMFSATAEGYHRSYWLQGEQPGYADNTLDLRWGVNSATGSASQSLLSERSLDRTEGVSRDFGAFNYGNSFDVVFNGWTWVYAVQSPDSHWGPTSAAMANIRDASLRIDYAEVKSAVPEPATGVMLLAGLALVAGVARRRV